MRSGDTNNVGRHDQHGLSPSHARSLLSSRREIAEDADRRKPLTSSGDRQDQKQGIIIIIRRGDWQGRGGWHTILLHLLLNIHYSVIDKSEHQVSHQLSHYYHIPPEMSSLSGNSILTTLGCLLIIHSAYSCLHYRSLALVADLTDTSSPPVDVIIEVILGFVTCLVGQLMCGPFHRVRVTGGPLLGSLPKTKGSGDSRHRYYIQVEIVAPVYRTRDFDLFSSSSSAATAAAATRRPMVMTRLKGN